MSLSKKEAGMGILPVLPEDNESGSYPSGIS